MASLLGSKYCIESLRGDVADLQAAVVDVLSRVGPSHSFRSWKYPDKVSADVDITNLLETYDYSEDEEERQIAHIVLMELVIDRSGIHFFHRSSQESCIDSPTSSVAHVLIKVYLQAGPEYLHICQFCRCCVSF